jgi:hypothetical protein
LNKLFLKFKFFPSFEYGDFNAKVLTEIKDQLRAKAQ